MSHPSVHLSVWQLLAFSKNGLREILSANGFAYRHISQLGCPKPIRDQYRHDGDWQRYTKDFKGYLDGQGEVIAELSEMAEASHCALLCFEADCRMCHRSMVAAAVEQASGTQVQHLSAAAIKTGKAEGRQSPLTLAGTAN